MRQFTKAERAGLKFLFFFASFVAGSVVWLVTNNNVIAFCTVVSLLSSCYWFIQAWVTPHKHHNKGIKLPPPTFKTTEPGGIRPDFNKWITEIHNQ